MKKKFGPFLDLCVSSLRRGHANLLCIVPILSDVPEGTSSSANWSYINACIIKGLTSVGLERSSNNTNRNNIKFAQPPSTHRQTASKHPSSSREKNSKVRRHRQIDFLNMFWFAFSQFQDETIRGAMDKCNVFKIV